MLALRDERTGGYHLRFDTECPAIFKSVAADGVLDGAIASVAQRLGVTKRLAMKDVFIASSLYRKGSLCPAAEAERLRQASRPDSRLSAGVLAPALEAAGRSPARRAGVDRLRFCR